MPTERFAMTSKGTGISTSLS